MTLKFKLALLKFTLLLGGVGLFNFSYAQCSSASSSVSITGTNCPNVVINSNKTDVTIQSGAYVGTTFGQTNPALAIQGVNVGSVENFGLIQGQSQNTSGIELSGNSVLSNINNTSQINGALYAIKLTDASSIGSINNSGSIINNGNSSPSQAIFLSTVNGSTSISTINNLGVINGSNGAIYLDTANGAYTASIGTINNSGSINGGQDAGILVGTGNSIGTINNNVGGEIRTGACNGLTCYNSIRNWGTINQINNSGAIFGGSGYGFFGYGIENNGTIVSLNNAQNNLSYIGVLPINYNIIIDGPTSYGVLSKGQGPGVTVSGQMNFGIDTIRSTIPINTTTYSSVLTGLTSANINPSTTSGTFAGGALVTTAWLLYNPSGGTSWNLLTTKTPNPAFTIPGSSAATAVAAVLTTQAANPTIQSNGISIGAAVSGLTTAQAQNLSQVHAEGYSSNMTIGLEQMAHITNTVMDRIHAPMTASPSTKVYQDDEGRYIWADAAAVKGTVNNYNNLAGFGYNLYDLIIGGDIQRSKEGGYGVFAGTGTTSMTESQQVTQNFNTTNYYAGLYGAYNFTEQVKLSGALGYMYGNTNANRSNPNVGYLVGGNANSSFNSNGMYAAAKLARAYQADNFTISPFIGASYSQLWMGGASEQGGNTFNYGINSATAYTAVTFAGADFIYPLLKGVNDPLSLIGFYKFGYDWYANTASAHTVTATTSYSGSTQSFAQVGANMGPVSNMVGLGIQGGITKEVSARIGIVASYNTYGHEYGGGAELRFKF